ncbi:hypothetical protein TPY_0548 [Sulfobacillus acidophilus TPY]|uniref:Uncharacterized protein n=1 Tax=Sulfobacillus acidophilus (strain ATCC 700253 / DSM 10332 / NAL) TaxID=679936 RepID=G8U1Q6_SULAD|nr:hypothetical protein TPY_0548 [Sulfobacillus acidophilus TPY]AEW06984.1 hypothetical protein Sulac_3551 [Sulfobacillus acidophilus DSM 10332]
MGARPFFAYAEASDVQEAFRAAVAEAQWLYGHSGDTGTIAEKDAVRVVTPPRPMTDDETCVWAETLLNEGPDDPQLDWIEDKWAPAAAVRLNAGGWLFFGWAAS